MEIYFEISKSQLNGLNNKMWSFNFPHNIKVSRKENSRACYISVEDHEIRDVIDYLDDSGLAWQTND